MIKEIRSYIKANIAKVDKDLKEYKSAFYRGDIPESIIDNSYQITIGPFVPVEREDARQADVTVELNIFGHGFNDEISNYDSLFEKAICISDNIVNLKSIDPQDFIIDARGSSIDPETIDTDENGFKFNMNFTLTVAYFRE